MTAVIAFISQKGGVGKSTLARALAREAVASDLSVKIADLDSERATIIDWHKTRTQKDIQPAISVELFRSAAAAIKAGAKYDLLVIDGPAMASAGTRLRAMPILSCSRPAQVWTTCARPSAYSMVS